ncbi:GntR family transcriptional regulator [Leucobacter viscericola]|uniref:GntR family transcriptional regulator n=1 Tax=Leucobacter viscericola TaxID=2714935 RepID=A0A6G7XGD8_9MICO|nr:GntR family transcriptional regulator [Leucobacter viscericola]QIK63509.1 GntR family transcriptional regulator [Leucobacter viscericola]
MVSGVSVGAEAGGEPGSHSRALDAAAEIRARISRGELAPGERVPEAKLAESLGVSRNTLREAFRALSEEGLITQIPNRGACVAIPNINTIIDIYRVRRLIECQAVAEAMPRHPAIARMRRAVEAALEARDHDDWPSIATSNIEFHRAIFELADSARLNRMYTQLTSELRLAFGLIDDPAYLHAPFLERNERILELLESGATDKASAALRDYLLLAERILLAGYERATAGV